MSSREKLVSAIQQEFDCTRAEASRILAGMSKAIRETLLSGDRVMHRHLGALIPWVQKGRLSRSVFSGQLENLPEKKTVVFKPTPDFRDDLNSGT